MKLPRRTRLPRQCLIGLFCGAALAGWIGPPVLPAEAAEPAGAPMPPAGQPSVDDALLEDLDNELLEGADLKRARKPPIAKRSRPAAADQADDGQADDGPSEGKAGTEPGEPDPPDAEGEDLGEPSAERDPLGFIGRQMRDAEALIPRRDKQAHAEQVQHRIVDDLARLIEQAERQQAAQQSGKSSEQRQSARRQSVQQPQASSSPAADGKSNQPAADSTDRLGKSEGVRPDAGLFQGLLKDAWGQLPQREREQMLQMSRERFVPRYELLIERYYRRLAEERVK